MIYIQYISLLLLVLFVGYGFLKILPASLANQKNTVSHFPDDFANYRFKHMGELPGRQRRLWTFAPIMAIVVLVSLSAIVFAATRAKIAKDNETIKMQNSEVEQVERALAASRLANLDAKKQTAFLQGQLDSVKFFLRYSYYSSILPNGAIAVKEGQSTADMLHTGAIKSSGGDFFHCISFRVDTIENDNLVRITISDKLAGRVGQVVLTQDVPRVFTFTDHVIYVEVQQIDLAARTVRLIPKIKGDVRAGNCN